MLDINTFSEISRVGETRVSGSMTSCHSCHASCHSCDETRVSGSMTSDDSFRNRLHCVSVRIIIAANMLYCIMMSLSLLVRFCSYRLNLYYPSFAFSLNVYKVKLLDNPALDVEDNLLFDINLICVIC